MFVDIGNMLLKSNFKELLRIQKLTLEGGQENSSGCCSSGKKKDKNTQPTQKK
jgi:hypothetical protein